MIFGEQVTNAQNYCHRPVEYAERHKRGDSTVKGKSFRLWQADGSEIIGQRDGEAVLVDHT